MSLTAQDLSAISGIIDTSINRAIDTKVKPLIADAVDDLTLQVGKGFNEVTENFAIVNDRLEHLEADVSELKTDMVEVKSGISELRLDMREVKWGLADTVRRAEFLDVRDRVTRLEHKSSSN